MSSVELARGVAIAPITGRYVTLDGMRGLAAVAVAILHFDKNLLPNAYMAVDFFFILSGFVLFEAYRDRISGGLSVRSFMIARLIRLYPLFCLSLLFSAVRFLAMLLTNPSPVLSADQLLISLSVNLLFFPSPVTIELFPLNTPAWSLFCELLINFAMIPLVLRLDVLRLTFLAGVAGVLLVLSGWFLGQQSGITELNAYPLAAGWGWEGASVGILRATTGFVIGLAISGSLRGKARSRNSAFALYWIALLLVLWLPVKADWLFVWNVFAIMAVFPLLVYAASRIEPPLLVTRFASWLGDISFAAYVIHGPIGGGIAAVARVIHWSGPSLLITQLGSVLLVSTFLTKWFDPFARRSLTKLLRLN